MGQGDSNISRYLEEAPRVCTPGSTRLALAALLIAASAFAQVNVLTANYDNQRTNANLEESILNLSNVNTAGFGKIGAFPVDGQIYAQPLYAAAVPIQGQGTRNVVFVVTMHNSVYAIDADALQSTTPLWKVNLGPSVPSSVLDFYDIVPEVGILSTPVIDLSRQVMYLVSDTLEKGRPVFRIHALSLADGHEMLNGPAVIAATVAGNGPGNVGGALSFDASLQLQRPGLALANGNVYAGFGSHSDVGAYHGWLIAYDASDLRRMVAVRNLSPNGEGASIWQTGRAPALDDRGNIYVATGNGDFDGTANFGESILKLSAADLSVRDFYTPVDWSKLNDDDCDLGSTGAILIPNTNLVVAGGKAGNLYLTSRDSMGHVSGNTSTAQSIQVNAGGIFDMALWNSPRGPIVYAQESAGSLQAYQIVAGKINGTMLSQTTPTATSVFAGIAVSANGDADGTAIIWETTGDYLARQVPGTLHAFDASDLSKELWNSNMLPGDALGRFAKFVAPTVVNGRVYVPTFSNQLTIYGLLAVGQPGTGPAQVTSIVNGASFLSDAVSPGEWLAIAGANLGPVLPSYQQMDGTGHVTTTLSGTQVFFDGLPAPLLYTSSNQVGAVVPFGTAGPATKVQLQYQDQLSPPMMIPVVPATPALFSQDGTGGGLGQILNEDGSTNGWDNPAKPGSVITLYATGVGQTDPAGDDGKVTTSSPAPAPILPMTVFIDSQSSEVVSVGAAQGMVQGLVEINARVPDTASGGEVRVMIRVGAYSSSNTVTLVVL